MITSSILQNLRPIGTKCLTDVSLICNLYHIVFLHHRGNLDKLLCAGEFVKSFHVQISITFSILSKQLSLFTLKKELRRFSPPLRSINDIFSLNMFDFHLGLGKGDELWPKDAERFGRNAYFDINVVSSIVHYKSRVNKVFDLIIIVRLFILIGLTLTLIT